MVDLDRLLSEGTSILTLSNFRQEARPDRATEDLRFSRHIKTLMQLRGGCTKRHTIAQDSQTSREFRTRARFGAICVSSSGKNSAAVTAALLMHSRYLVGSSSTLRNEKLS